MKPNSLATPNKNVFINCPFDREYAEFFQAICFTIQACGFDPRCALEDIDSGEVRLDKIRRIISECALGIHDISRTELSPTTHLPRFNMPFELGLYLGCKFYGSDEQRAKRTLILDRDRYRYRQFLSDIGGQDPEAHFANIPTAIEVVRNWLQCSTPEPLAGPLHLTLKFQRFCFDLPQLTFELGVNHDQLAFKDLYWTIRRWLTWQAT
ncbi:MAG: hypothetical protein JST93_13280 [Acidobacteria bacterium]|nr:hypothetical protein [Acidobacteriota bacterium]